VAIASLILGVVGTVTGVGALTWQVITWTRSGPVVTLTAGPLGWSRKTMTVTAVNSGRGPVSIMRLEIRDLYGLRIRDLKLAPDSEQLPFRLEPSASVSWQVDIPALVEQRRPWPGSDEWARELEATMESPDHDMRVHAILGNGKTVQSGPISRGRGGRRRGSER
jgi:hypothetical protein